MYALNGEFGSGGDSEEVLLMSHSSQPESSSLLTSILPRISFNF